MRSTTTASTSGWSRPSQVRTISGSDRPASSSKYSCADSGRPRAANRSAKIRQRIGSSSESVPLKSKITARARTGAKHKRARIYFGAQASTEVIGFPIWDESTPTVQIETFPKRLAAPSLFFGDAGHFVGSADCCAFFARKVPIAVQSSANVASVHGAYPRAFVAPTASYWPKDAAL